MTTLQDKLDNIYQTKLEIKSAIGTDSDVFSEYPGMIRSMAGGGVSYSYLDERLSYCVEIENLNTTLSYYVEIENLNEELSYYVETSYLESMGYATESYVTNAINNIPSVDTSSYVTYTYLESKEYATESYVSYVINNIPSVDTSSYVTYSYLDSCGYVTSNDLPVINESIIPKEPHTYTLGDSSHFYDELYVNRSYCGATYFTTSSYIHPISSSQVDLDLAHNIFSFSDDSLFTENADLGKHDKYWNNGYISNTYTNNLYLGSYNITDLINNMFSYDISTGVLTITTIS